MRKLGFWSNSEGQQKLAINEAADEISALQSSAGDAQRKLTALHAIIKAQQAELLGLKAALQAVCDLLVDQDLVEEEALAQRIAAAIADPPPSILPAAPAAPAPSRLKTGMKCAGCQRDFSARALTFTERGPLCTQCINAAER